MKDTLTTNQAANMLREDEYGGWSYAGAYAMVEYLEQLEDDCGFEIEMDVVAIRCDYSEYSDVIDATEQYISDPAAEFGIEEGPDADEELEEACREYLQNNTTLIEFNGGVIIQDF